VANIASYLIADYDRHSFSVSQCKWDANAEQSIVPIYPPSPPSSTTTSTSSSTPDPSPSASSIGRIAGAAIGAFLLFFLLAFLAFYFLVLKPRRAHTNAAQRLLHIENPDPILKAELHAQDITVHHEMQAEAVLPAEIDGALMVEIDSQHTRVYEMPAVEEVAAEVGEGEAAELQGMSLRRKFSWEMTTHCKS
jgi:hypothetical protein